MGWLGGFSALGCLGCWDGSIHPGAWLDWNVQDGSVDVVCQLGVQLGLSISADFTWSLYWWLWLLMAWMAGFQEWISQEGSFQETQVETTKLLMTYFQKLRSVTSTSLSRSKSRSQSQVQGEGITQGHEHQQEWFIEGKGGIWRLDTILINSYISFCFYVFGSLIWIVNSLRTRILPYIFVFFSVFYTVLGT